MPPYFERYGLVTQHRWFSIEVHGHALDVDCEPVEVGFPPHLRVFAPDYDSNVELLWRLRCAWFDFNIGWEEAAADVRILARDA